MNLLCCICFFLNSQEFYLASLVTRIFGKEILIKELKLQFCICLSLYKKSKQLSAIRLLLCLVSWCFCIYFSGYSRFRLRTEGTTKATTKALQSANTSCCDVDTMPMEVLRRR